MQEKLTDLCSSVVSSCRKRSFTESTDCGTIQCMEMGFESKSANKRTRFEDASRERRASKFESIDNSTFRTQSTYGKCTCGKKCKYNKD